jgi:hypothetical protein
MTKQMGMEPRAEGGSDLKAVVVYESIWGSTAAIARAIAEGIGPGARAVRTDEATAEVVSDADLLVAGAPVMAFGLPTEGMRARLASTEAAAPAPPDLAHPSLRSWLGTMPRGHGRSAAFETRIWWSPRGATGDIERRLTDAGFPPIAKGGKFVVVDKYGPLRAGEVERARAWGHELAEAVRDG